MSFKEFLEKRREEIRENWIRRIVNDYPAESVKFIRSEKDRFRNPIGSTIEKGTRAVMDGLIEGVDRAALKGTIDGMVRLRAVQDFPPSMAVAFIQQLKEEVRRVVDGNGFEVDREQLQRRIDDLLFDAFDLYTQCREKVFEIRLNEVKARTWKLLERAEEAEVQRGAER